MNKFLALTSDYLGMIYKNSNRDRNMKFKDYVPFDIEYEAVKEFYSPLKVELYCKKISDEGSHEFGRYYFDDLGGIYYRSKQPTDLNAIIVHGWKSSSFKDFQDTVVEPLIARGYNVYLPILPYHMERTPEGSTSGEKMISSDLEMTVYAIQKAVSEIRTLISSIKAHDNTSKIFLAGISLGGLVINLASCFDSNIDLLNPILYLESLSFNIWNSRFFIYIKNVLVENGVSYERLKEKLNILEAANWVPQMDTRNILLIKGKYDRFVLYNNSLQKKWSITDQQMKIVECGHAGLLLSRKDIFTNTVSYFGK